MQQIKSSQIIYDFVVIEFIDVHNVRSQMKFYCLVMCYRHNLHWIHFICRLLKCKSIDLNNSKTYGDDEK